MMASYAQPKEEALKVRQNETGDAKPSIIGDPKKYIYTSLFNKTYVLNDFKIDNPDHWSGKKGDFEHFYDNFFSICQGTSEAETKKWNHTDTLNNWVLPILHFLGWGGISGGQDDTFSQHKSIYFTDETGSECIIKPSVLVAESPEGNKRIKSSKIDTAFQEVKNYGLLSVSTGYYESWSEKRSGKYDTNRDELTKLGDVYSNYNNNEKASYYLQALGHNWAMATDGYTWRLYNKEYAYSNNSFFEFKLGRLFDDVRTSKVDKEDERFKEAVKFFYWFFSKDGLFGRPISVASETLSKSKNYFDGLEDDLKGRFVHAMTIAVNGLCERHKSISSKELDLELARDTAESLIFTLLFIRSCESRRVIPLNQRYLKVALASLVRKIKDFDPHASTDENFERINFGLSSHFGKPLKPSGVEVYEYISELKQILESGSGAKYEFGFKISGFEESVFTRDELNFLNKVKLSNDTLLKLLFEIFYEYSGNKNQEIPFESFTPRNLGSIFESFLEFKVATVHERHCHIKKIVKGKVKWQWLPMSKLREAEKSLITYSVNRGQLRFKADDEEKEAAGAYYTPDYVVRYIVSESLGPLTAGRSSSQILKIKVCDPAMGSGHFLVAALNFLTAQYVTALSREERLVAPQELVAAKRQVLDSCIFGVDINSRAVKLAKLSLWLESASINQKLENLDDQIKRGDSLISKLADYENTFDWQKQFFKPKNFDGFDAVIGNPPYLKEANHKDYFRKLRASDQAKYCTNKMDLWYLFSIKAMSILKSGWRHSFIVPSTWLKAEAAGELRLEINLNSRVEKLVDFMDYKVFSNASIQTMIFILQKEPTSDIYSAEFKSYDGEEDESAVIKWLHTKAFDRYNHNPKSKDEPFVIAGSKTENILNKISSTKHFTIKPNEFGSGIDVLQETVAKNHLEKLKGRFSIGDGIFVLSEAERASIKWNKREISKVVPFYETAQIKGYAVNPKNAKWLIYADKDVRHDIGSYPNIKRHLDKFEKVLTSQYAPYGLHCPRDEKWFLGEKLLCVRKTKSPAFSVVKFPCYVSRMFTLLKPKTNLNYYFLMGVLNSTLVHFWLWNKGKRQGKQLQVDKAQVCGIPIVDPVSSENIKLADRVSCLAEGLTSGSRTLSRQKAAEVLAEIDEAVFDLYGLSAQERQFVREFVKKAE